LKIQRYYNPTKCTRVTIYKHSAWSVIKHKIKIATTKQNSLLHAEQSVSDKVRAVRHDD